MRPPGIPTGVGGGGGGRFQLTEQVEAVCVHPPHRFFRIKRIRMELCLEPAEPPSFLPTCFASQKTQLGAFCVTGLHSEAQWQPPSGTHRRAQGQTNAFC